MLLRSSVATLIGLFVHYVCAYGLGFPLWPEAIAEWIMARTPSGAAVAMMEWLGAWAKPFAVTGGLAALGAAVGLADLAGGGRSRSRGLRAAVMMLLLASAFGSIFEYGPVAGQISFWVPAWVSLLTPFFQPVQGFSGGRRQALVMTAGTAAVALESYLRNRSLAGRTMVASDLPPAIPPVRGEGFGGGLARKAVTPVAEFYAMSKNAVDPSPDLAQWRLRITQDGQLMRDWSYKELLAMPRVGRFVTLRCISNTLQSDLMGTAWWSGVRLNALVRRELLRPSVREAAIIGIDGHGDSFSLDYAFSDDVFFALAMNGKTLDRSHGFPIRFLAPRYYGFKSIKWIGEIAFRTETYVGTWPKLGYTREPVVHTASHIDRFRRSGDGLEVSGTSFAGDRGIQVVELRVDNGPWIAAALDPPLSPYCWTRWYAKVRVSRTSKLLEVRAQDGRGQWQPAEERPLFPDGAAGPTIRRLPS